MYFFIVASRFDLENINKDLLCIENTVNLRDFHR
jgi:hypothetical protein